ncbi:hypothetical protein LTR17_011085 [Elasticomyces elasticus]|nr:hypothetical protein LTR17_011085 [Elasticomyces elasticus]
MLLEPHELKKSAEIYPGVLEKNPAPHVDRSDYTPIRAGVAFLEASALAQLNPPDTSIRRTRTPDSDARRLCERD